jgi:hypothetical protein
MVERLRRALGYGPAPWLNKRLVQSGLGLLSLWAIGTMASGVWSAATVGQPSQDQVDSFLASVLMPGLVLPAIVLAWLGSRLAWALIVAFEGLDVLNNLGGLDGLVFHLALAVLVILAAVAVWRFRTPLRVRARPREAPARPRGQDRLWHHRELPRGSESTWSSSSLPRWRRLRRSRVRLATRPITGTCRS